MSEVVQIERTLPRLAPSRVRRVSWGAIFAGMFVAIVIQIMLTLLGVSVGIVTQQGPQSSNALERFVTASGIWLLVTGLISTWVGACVAGRLSGGPRRADGMLHGLVTWSVATVAMFGLLATTLGVVLGGTAALVSNALASNDSPGQNPLASLVGQVQRDLPQAGQELTPTGRNEGRQAPGQLTELAQQDSELALALGRLETKGGATKAPQDRDIVITLLTTKHNLSQQDAENLVNQWDQQSSHVRAQVGQKADEVKQTAAHVFSQGAFWAFVALLLGMLVAAWGGWAGTASLPRPTEAAAVRT